MQVERNNGNSLLGLRGHDLLQGGSRLLQDTTAPAAGGRGDEEIGRHAREGRRRRRGGRRHRRAGAGDGNDDGLPEPEELGIAGGGGTVGTVHAELIFGHQFLRFGPRNGREGQKAQKNQGKFHLNI